MNLSRQNIGIVSGIVAAIFVAISIPLCKLFLDDTALIMTAGLLNAGAGLGIGLIWLCTCRTERVKREEHLRKRDVPLMAGACAAEICAAIAMVVGLVLTSAANASLLQNFETVMTAVIALIIFKECIPFRLWIGIILITLGSLFLTIQDPGSFTFSPGSFLILLACAFWGVENNFTKKLAHKNPLETVFGKSMVAGIVTIIIGFAAGEQFPAFGMILPIFIVGLLGYGLNVLFLIISERHLGAARACTIYGVYPFLAAIIACLLFTEQPSGLFILAALLMVFGFYFASTARRKKRSHDE